MGELSMWRRGSEPVALHDRAIANLRFMGIGILALFWPATWGDFYLGADFGGLHVVFGGLVARRHGG